VRAAAKAAAEGMVGLPLPAPSAGLRGDGLPSPRCQCLHKSSSEQACSFRVFQEANFMQKAFSAFFLRNQY